MKYRLLRFFLCALLSVTALWAQAETDTEVTSPSLTSKGADTCLKCHDEDNDYPVMPIFRTAHGNHSDPNSPFAQLQCESCHGGGAEHAKKISRGETRPPIINFGSNSSTPVAEQNGMCMSCHQNSDHMFWPGSPHESNDVACASCHTLHTETDPVMELASQDEVCTTCHKQQRADLHKRSSHPILEGQMTCTGCHEPHGSAGDHLLKTATTNDTCYTCHAEKRGPVIWQHAPVDEDCALCHNPHGSNHESLLTKRTPLLCRECHAPSGHPSLSPSGTGLPDSVHPSFSKFATNSSCLNCHSKIHGSNHPSGVKLMR